MRCNALYPVAVNRNRTVSIVCLLGLVAQLPAQPAAAADFDCYARQAEAAMRGRKTFLRVDADPKTRAQVRQSRSAKTTPGGSPNPVSASSGLLHHWTGTIFIPGVGVDRAIRMLQDYDHRARYFGELLSDSTLRCRTGDDRFSVAMRLREPAAIDTENDVVWERVAEKRWQSTSYSTKVQEVGGDHNYLLRLNSYWRFAEADGGVYIEAETITLSGRFSSAVRAVGSLLGISPEKSLRKTLDTIRKTVSDSRLQFADLPTGLPSCPVRPALKECSL